MAGMHTVDFTIDPLRTAGLFSISGPTGSGKSTLLDALCLALYERTPRLHQAKGNVRVPDVGEGILPRDPANLLRRGTGEGFAEVAFVGVDGATYTARWSVRRARMKSDGALQNSELTLFQGNIAPGGEGPIAVGGKKTEVLAAIAARVGLTFEQFTRAVLLAQNDFAHFLKADDRERAEILQALTGTERFERISVAAYDRAARERRKLEEIEQRLAGQAPLAAEPRAEAEAVVERAEAALKAVNERLGLRTTHLAWFQRHAELSQAVVAADTALARAVADREAAAPRRKELDCTTSVIAEARPLADAADRAGVELASAEQARLDAVQAETTARTALDRERLASATATQAFAQADKACTEAQAALRQARELDARLVPAQERLAQCTREREAGSAELQRAIEALKDLTTKRETTSAQIGSLTEQDKEHIWLEPFVADSTAWLDRLDYATRASQALATAVKTAATRQTEEAEQAKARQAAAESAAKAQATATAAGNELAEAEKHFAAFDAEQLAAERRRLETDRAALHELQRHLLDRQAITESLTSLDRDAATLHSSLERDRKALAELHDRGIPAANVALSTARRSHELAEAAVDDAAVRLREKLGDGTACPVCGATDHPYSSHPPDPAAQALRALREEVSRHETHLHSLQTEAARLQAAVEHEEKELGKTTEAQSKARERLQNLSSFQPAQPSAQAVLQVPQSERLEATTKYLESVENAMRGLETTEAQRRAAEKRRDQCRIVFDQAATALKDADTKLSDATTELSRRQSARESADATRQQCATAAEQSATPLAPLFTASPWGAESTDFRPRFERECTASLARQKRLAELAGELRELDARLTPARESLTRVEAELVARQKAENTARGDFEALCQQRTALLGGRPADAVEEELRTALKAAAEARDHAQLSLAEADKTCVRTTEAQASATRLAAESLKRKEATAEALQQWLRVFSERTGAPFTREDLTLRLQRDEGWIKAERAALDALDAAVASKQGSLAVHRDTLTRHVESRPTPDDEPTITAELATLRAQLTTCGEERDRARTVIAMDDQRRVAAASLTQELEAGRAALRPWERLNDLIGSADGAKFRGIAQRRTLDILLGYANAQLELFAARYRLERLPESLNLIVIDREMADERRSVHSLSGGESFLVSLALALALASLTSNRLRIESLFIDEGFGSLDPTTLNTAMSALMQLEAQGRKVGVISHVSEMADAIPVQIKVVKGRGGASRLVVPGMDETSVTPPPPRPAPKKARRTPPTS